MTFHLNEKREIQYSITEQLHHLITLPMVSNLCVTNNVLAPIRAEAAHASVPACPPPITIQSYTPGKSVGDEDEELWIYAIEGRSISAIYVQ